MHQPFRLLAVAFLITASAVFAQRGPGVQPPPNGRASPHETISVNLSNRVISITYGRPYTKAPGNGAIRKVWALDTFVPSPWRLGADEATLLVTPAPLVFGTVTIPPGSYTLYMTYTDAGPADLVFSRNIGKWGIPVDTTSDVAKVPLERSVLDPANDQLRLAFEPGPTVNDPVTLKIMWDNRQYSARFTVR